MADASEVGRYGTIRLMKRTEEDGVVASYPIDDEVVTFGRDPTCSVRLYYQWVSTLHCKIIFEERKVRYAFLQVMGGNGVVVDGCQVLPIRSGATSEPTTIPLINGSNFIIHKKRFVFNYPPKELRPHLFTPAAKRRGSLRLSMITSAQVFSPRPSMNPRENLRILQSPLRPFAGSDSGDDEVVKLVDGNHPKVVEEEQDLVILESVENVSPAKALPPQPQVTPRRKSMPSLHRAVLIRSAQRAQQQLHHRNVVQDADDVLDPELEDVDEEEEVEEAIIADLSPSEESEEEPDNRDAMLEDEDLEVYNEDGTEGTGTDNQEEDDMDDQTTPTTGFRSMLENIRPMPSLFSRFTSGEKTPRKVGPQRPPPGSRMSLAPGLDEDDQDLSSAETSASKRGVKQEEDVSSIPARPIVSAEERQAIIDRRKSAMKAPSPDFEHVPGSRRTSALPPPIQQSPFKKIGKGIDDGEETKAVLARMQETLEDMRAKKSSAVPASPGIGRGQGMLSPSPEKPTFSLLARGVSPRMQSPVFTAPTRQAPILEDHQMDDADELDVKKDEEDSRLSAIRTTKDVPKTPRLDGVRDLFRVPTNPATPSFRGMRELFGKTDAVPKQARTPRLEGVKEMFAEPKKVDSPRYDGVEDMMTIPEEEDIDITGLDEEASADVVEEPSADKLCSTRPTRSIPKAGARARQKALRGNVTDSSTMADDEASLLEDHSSMSSGTEPSQGSSEAILPQRAIRARRPKLPPSDVNEQSVDEPKAKTRRGRPPSIEEDDSPTTAEQGSSTSPPSEVDAPKPRRKAATSSSTENDEQPAPKTRRRTAKKAAEDHEPSDSVVPNPKPATDGRRTRSRAASVEHLEEEDPLDSIPRQSSPERSTAAKGRRGTRAKPSKEVESIPETDEQESAPPPVRKALGRPRRVKEEPSDDVLDTAPPKKKVGGGRRKVIDVDVSSDNVQGKENTPEPSPISPIDVGMGFKEEKKAGEKSTRATRVKREEKPTTTRTTRARSRK
ncbi:hypothetical protein SCHPADRAFT_865893 [Schizopora paradoxa]|uniref:FHA domain-containing protein n=1 Tax=Schizopora paradoxa TaxID=27342 RepID=A0A0H2S3Y6_9AGAM|nr:hypothetical protein SCHPADRAFT_865893 [Schizopora paradoxa]